VTLSRILSELLTESRDGDGYSDGSIGGNVRGDATSTAFPLIIPTDYLFKLVLGTERREPLSGKNQMSAVMS
jgi:hypothetical protein